MSGESTLLSNSVPNLCTHWNNDECIDKKLS